MTKQCELMVGFLIPRQCDGKARSTCIRCGKAICDEHAVFSPQGVLCEACHLGVEQLAETRETPAWVASLPAYRSADFDAFDDDADTLFDDMS